MKKIYFSFSLFLLAASATCQDIDYTLRASYSYADTSWHDNLRSTYSYEDGNLILINAEYMFPDSLNWSPVERIIYEYNADGTISERRREDWNENSSLWDIKSRILYAYNSSGSILLETHENRIEEVWVPESKNESVYDSNNILTVLYTYFWDTTTDDWLLTYRSQYTYNTDGNTENVLHTIFQNGQWNYQNEHNYIYTDFGKIAEIATPVDTATNGTLSGDRWRYDYDASNNLIDEVFESIFPTTQNWRQLILDTYMYYPDGSLQSSIRQMNIGVDSAQWVNFSKASYFYLTPNFVPTRESFQFALFPNPAGNEVYIQTSEPLEPSYYNILSMEGKTILSGSLTTRNQAICTTSLAAGIYLLELRAGDKIGVSKLVKE